MVNLLAISVTCASQTAFVVWPATKFFSATTPLQSGVRALFHFPACFIKQWNLASMKENNSYDVYSKAAWGTAAGIVKYVPRGYSKDGFAIKNMVLGGFNNLAYHMAPEIYENFVNNTEPDVSQLGLSIAIEITENLLNILAFGGTGTVTQAVSNGFELGILLKAFGGLQDTAESALAMIIPFDYNDIETMVHGTNTTALVNDEL